jgi:hypothetical protein
MKSLLTNWSHTHIGHWARSQHINGVYPVSFPSGRKTKVGVNIEITNGFKHGETDLKKPETKAYDKMAVDEYDSLTKGNGSFLFYISSKDQLDNAPEIKICINNYYNPNHTVPAGSVASCMH